MHDTHKLLNTIECLLYVANRPVPAGEIKDFFSLEDVLLSDLMEHMASRFEERGLKLQEVAGGYEVVTREEYAKFVEQFFTVKEKRRLSVAALEVLSIIAYRQPVTRFEVEEIRGVNSDAVTSRLLDLNLIKITGRRETVGRPYEFGVTTDFLHYFGLKDMKDLPPMDEGLASLMDNSLERAQAKTAAAEAPVPPMVEEVAAEEEAQATEEEAAETEE